MDTPFYILHEELLQGNLNGFKRALTLHWANSSIAYSVKTNALPWVLKYMRVHGVMAEAVSDEEYQLAKLCGFQDNQIVFNGPIKTTRQLLKAIDQGAIVNIDSERELSTLIKREKNVNENIGIRVNIDIGEFEQDDIEYLKDGFRFGFSQKNGRLCTVIDSIKKKSNTGRFGLHFHCNSITRSLNVYRSISRFAAKIIKEYDLSPSYIDIGGGFFGGMPNKPDAETYILAIKEILNTVVDPQSTKLIIEPGTALIGSVVELHTTVLDVKDTEYARIVTTDGSRLHIDPLWKKTRHLYTVQPTSICRTSVLDKQIVCGYTCMDYDRIMFLADAVELHVGDRIIYEKVGAYSVTLGGPFIQFFPDVYMEKNGNVELIRKRMTVQQYYNMETNVSYDGGDNVQ